LLQILLNNFGIPHTESAGDLENAGDRK